MKKCLVLGAGGFMGKKLCARLSKTCSIRAFEFSDKIDLNALGAEEVVIGDFCKVSDFEPLLDGVDTVYHLISTTLPVDGTRNVMREAEENVLPTLRLLEGMKKAGTGQIVFASSGGTIYGDCGDRVCREDGSTRPKSSYGLQKQMIEDCIRFYDTIGAVKAKIARIANPYGAGQKLGRPQGVIPIFIGKLLGGEPITIYGADSIRSYLYLDDLIEALVRLGEYQGQHSVMNIASKETCSLRELIRIIERTLDRRFSNITYEGQRAFDVDSTYLDTSLARRELGWEAKTTLDEGIRLTWKQMTGA